VKSEDYGIAWREKKVQLKSLMDGAEEEDGGSLQRCRQKRSSKEATKYAMGRGRGLGWWVKTTFFRLLVSSHLTL